MIGAASGWLLRCLLGAACVVGSFAASAAGGNTNQPLTLAQISARNVQAKHGLADPQWRLNQGTPAVVTSGTAGGALVKVVQTGPGPVTSAQIASTRILTRPALLRAVARSLPVVGNALVIAELLETLRCQEGFGGGAECDLGTVETEIPGYSCYAGVHTGAGPTPMAACAPALEAYYRATYADPYYGSQAFQTWETGSVFSCATFNPALQTGSCSRSWKTSQGSQSKAATWTKTVILECPAINTGAGLITPAKGVDGKCPTLTYTPTNEDAFIDRAEEWGGAAAGAGIANDLLGAGAPVEHEFPSIQPESPVQVDRETTTHPDGSVTVRDTSYPWASSPEGYGWQPRVREETFPPGAEIPPPVADAPGGTVTEGTKPEEKQITCGLPDTPPCKIDETGTPVAVAADSLNPPTNPAQPVLDLIGAPGVADVSWSWSFQLPTGCSVIPMGTFGGRAVTFDLCAYQPMIHDLVSMAWLIAGVLGGWLMLSRTLTGSA